ncbi:MAG: biotin--[acetyl-CoA-carboxylase] ligase [Verrucomicrobiota bacterium]
MRSEGKELGLVRKFERLEEVDSTNSELLRRIEREGAESARGMLLLAEHQSGGRGRRERVWESDHGGNLLCSLALVPPFERESWGWIAQIAALAVSDALVKAGARDLKVKWPNDVMISGRKVAGILVESRAGSSEAIAVIGVGVNVASHPGITAVEGMASTSLRQEGLPEADVEDLCVDYVRSLESWLNSAENGFEECRRELMARSFILGRQVRVTTDRGEIEGTAVGLSESGALILRAEDGERTVLSAERLRVVEP